MAVAVHLVAPAAHLAVTARLAAAVHMPTVAHIRIAVHMRVAAHIQIAVHTQTVAHIHMVAHIQIVAHTAAAAHLPPIHPHWIIILALAAIISSKRNSQPIIFSQQVHTTQTIIITIILSIIS